MKFLFVLAIVGLAAAGALADDGNANQLVDQIVSALTKKAEIDPFHMPDHTFQVDKKIGVIHLKGEVHIKNGLITGLSHAARNGDATIGNKNGTYDAHLRLGDKNIKFHADIDAVIGKILRPKATLDSEIGDIDVKMSLAVTPEGKFQLEDFEIDEFKHVQIHVHGLAILDPLIDLIGDGFIAFFNPNARRLLTNLLRPVIEEQLKNFHPGF